jgi:hypothetical protein
VLRVTLSYENRKDDTKCSAAEKCWSTLFASQRQMPARVGFSVQGLFSQSFVSEPMSRSSSRFGPIRKGMHAMIARNGQV